MPGWAICSVLTFALLGQTGDEPGTAVAEAAIREAVVQLGSPKFSARRQASRFLWSRGLAAEADLQRAAESPDREVRYRARKILDDFRYGILPGVPADVVSLLRGYRDGAPEYRPAIFQQLVRRGRFGEVQQLLELEENADVRKSLLLAMIQQDNAVERYADVQRLEALIEKVGRDQEPAWRRAVLAELLFSDKMIQRLLEDERLGVLLEVVRREPTADGRREMLTVLFGNQTTIAALIEREQLDFLLNLIAKEPDAVVRTAWIEQLLAGSETIGALAADDSLERVLAFAGKQMQPEQRSEMLERMFKNYTIVGALLEERGLQRLVALASREKDPALRGRTLAALVGSHAIQRNLSPQVQIEWMMKVGREEKSEIARAAYLEVLMKGGTIYVLLQDPTCRRELWEMVKSTSPPDDSEGTWRGDAVYRILSYSSAADVLKQPEETAWLFEFLRAEAAETQRVQILERLLRDYRTQQILARHERVDEVLSLIQQQPQQTRGRLLERFATSGELIQQWIRDGHQERLIALADEEGDDEVRLQYLSGLFRNQAAMTEMIKEQGYQQLWELVLRVKDPVPHASLRGDFFSTSAVIAVVGQKSQLASLVEFARQERNPEARREYLQRLCDNSYALSKLIDDGHYETLHSLVEGEPDEASRRTMLAAFYVNSKVVEQLVERRQIERMLDFAAQQLGGNGLTNYLQRIIYNHQTVAAIVEQHQLDNLLGLIRNNQNKYLRGSMMRTVLSAPKVMEHFVAQDHLTELFDLIAEEPEQVRQQIFSGLLSRSEAVKALVENKQVETILELIAAEPNASTRGSLLGRLAAHAAFVDYLVAKEQLTQLLQIARDESDPAARRQYLQSLFGSTAAVDALLEAGHFEEMVRLANTDPDVRQSVNLRARLLSNSRTVEYLVDRQQVGQLLDLVTMAADGSMRQQVLGSVAASETAVAALIDNGQFPQLLQLCRAYANAATERQLLATLLVSSKAVRELARMKRLEATVNSIVDQSDEDARRQAVRSWLVRPEALTAMLEHGQFDALYEVVKSEPNNNERDRLLGYLLTNRHAIVHLAEHDRIGWLIEQLAEGISSAYVARHVRAIVQQPESVKTIIVGGHFEPLMQLVDDKVSAAERQSLVRTMVSNQVLRQTLVESGHSDALRELIELEPDERLRQTQMQRLMYGPSGIMSYHLRRGEWEEVEKLLEAVADDDLGRLRLATFLLIAGRLEPRIARLQQRVQQHPEEGDLRLLTYLLRAQGDLSAACESARQTGDAGLLKPLLVESGQWAEAARLQAAEPCPLPIAPREQRADDELHRQAEQLGLIAAYQRLGGLHDAAEETLNRLKQLVVSHPDDTALAWFGIEALLLNDRVDDGLTLLVDVYPVRAFQLLLYRHEYDRAFGLARLDDSTVIDDAWLEGLPAAEAGDSPLLEAKCFFALTVAAARFAAGRRQQALEIVHLVRRRSDDLPDARGYSSPHNKCRLQVATALVQCSDFAAAADLAAETLEHDGHVHAMLLPKWFPWRQYEARAWWHLLRSEHESEPVADSLQRLARAMDPRRDGEDHAVDRLIARFDRTASRLADDTRQFVAAAIAEACLAHDRTEDALRFTALLPEADSYNSLKAKVLRAAERWEDAAVMYLAVWEQNHDQLAALYLSGDALLRAGQADEGRRRMQQADRSALDSRNRLNMAVELLNHGLQEEAWEQFRVVLRTAPFEYWEWHEAARRLGETHASEDAEQIVAWLESALLDDLRTWFFLLKDTDYLRSRSNLNLWYARAAIQRDDRERVQRHIDRALAASPGETRVAEDLVPLLEQKGWTEMADRVFGSLAADFQTKIEQYPDSALLHNNFAWMSARCGRQLETALTHAERAVKLAPDSAAYLDTLAEVQFRLGDRDAAVRHSRLAVQLRPGDAELRRQLRRFQHDPPP